MNALNQQLNLFYIALAFLTRIPVSKAVDFSQQNLNRASRYFPLVGWVVGGLCAIGYLLTSLVLPAAAAIILTMIFSLMLTGCFHEDGLADTCDGFGGGWNKQQKLDIMKDSRIGTYGSTALWSALSLKFVLLNYLDNVVVAFIVAHALSRAVSTSFIFWLPYVTDLDSSKVKPLAESQDRRDLKISLIIGAVSLLLVPEVAMTLIIVLVIIAFGLRHILTKQIGGFTGDTLGATQQICELMVYAVLVSNVSSL